MGAVILLALIFLGIFGMIIAALQAADKGTTITIYPDGRMTEQEGDGPVIVLRGPRK